MWGSEASRRLIFLGQEMIQTRDKLEMQIVKVKSLSHVRLFATPWTVAY